MCYDINTSPFSYTSEVRQNLSKMNISQLTINDKTQSNNFCYLIYKFNLLVLDKKKYLLNASESFTTDGILLAVGNEYDYIHKCVKPLNNRSNKKSTASDIQSSTNTPNDGSSTENNASGRGRKKKRIKNQNLILQGMWSKLITFHRLSLMICLGLLNL